MNIAIVDDEIHYARQIQDCLKSSELWSSDIAIDVFESTIIDERHFPSRSEANGFVYRTLLESDNNIRAIVVDM